VEPVILQDVVVLLAVAVLTVVAFRRLNLPPILAYLMVGVFVGPHGLDWLGNGDETRLLAEMGIVFLLFSVGLEFSLPQLMSMKREVMGVGGAQVLLTAAAAAAVAWLVGVPAKGAAIIGGVIAMSSTAVVIKQLREQLELNSRHGRLSVGILLFQDLAVIPFLIVIPALAGGADHSITLEVLISLVKGAVVLMVMLAIGHWALRPLFQGIISLHSAELFTLTVLLFSLSAAWITHLFGLSLMLGAFLAGMMLGETAFRHQVEADIRPFRDVLLGLFFITVGMLLDIHTLPQIIHWVLLIVVAMILFKTLSIMALGVKTGAEKGVALRTGIVLSQGGEFGFALIALALKDNLLTPLPAQIILAAIIISMALSPVLIRYNGWFAKRWLATSYGGGRQEALHQIESSAQDLDQHILICGYGRIGQNVSRFVERAGFNYIALDLDPIRVQEANAAGQHAYYGDSTHLDLLIAAGLPRARVLVISFADTPAAFKILEQVRKVRPELPILVRTADDGELERLQAAGATEVIPEILEATLMLVFHLLYLLDIPVNRIMRQIQAVRSDRYRILRQVFHGQESFDVEEPDALREGLRTVTLVAGANAVGKQLQELKLDDFDVTVTAVRREGTRGLHPKLDTKLHEGDVVVLYGTPEAIERAESALLSGLEG
jgi:CPA2 family monovalent cation:H+ antiporter-2